MQKRSRISAIAVLGTVAALVVMLGAGRASAAQPIAVAPNAGETAPHVRAAEAPRLDLCLAIDDSASMWSATDQGPASDPGPNPLRAQAARIAISLLGADVNNPRDGVGAVLFGTATHPGTDVVALPVTPLTSNVVREALATRIEQSLWSKGYTRVDNALATCFYLLHASGAPAAKSRTVLLTDGIPASDDPQFDASGQLRAAGWVLDALRAEHSAVDVILLGPMAAPAKDDPASFARQIADRTGGNVYVARERTDLFRIYTQIVSNETGRNFLQGGPLTINRRAIVPVRVEPGTASLTATVVKSDAATSVALRDGRGNLVPDRDLDRTSTGLVETLTVQDPAAGAWQVELSGAGIAYVSMVLRPVATPPVPAPTVVTPTATARAAAAVVAGPSPPTPSRSSTPTGSIVIAIAAVLGIAALAVAALAMRSRLISGHLQGIVALADEPGRRIGLDEVARRHRLLGVWQQRVPLWAVFDAFGEVSRTDAFIARRRGQTIVVDRDGPEAAPAVQLIEGGRVYAFGEPPVPLVFADDPAELPDAQISFGARPTDATAAQAAPAGLFGPSVDAFGDSAMPDAAPAEQHEDEPAHERAGALLAAALDDDRWSA